MALKFQIHTKKIINKKNILVTSLFWQITVFIQLRDKIWNKTKTYIFTHTYAHTKKRGKKNLKSNINEIHKSRYFNIYFQNVTFETTYKNTTRPLRPINPWLQYSLFNTWVPGIDSFSSGNFIFKRASISETHEKKTEFKKQNKKTGFECLC